MIKALLSIFTLFSLSANAQYNIQQNFDGAAPFDGVITFGTGAADNSNSCSGNGSFAQSFLNNEMAGGPAIDFSTLAIPQLSNGEEITVSARYKKIGTLKGTVYLTLNTYNASTDLWSFDIITSKAINSPEITTCTSIEDVLPVGKVLEQNLTPGSKYAIGVYFVKNTGSGMIYFDDLSIIQGVPTSIPNCTTIIKPTNFSTIPSGQADVEWQAVSGATTYHVKIGTSSGNADVVDKVVPATALSNAVFLNKGTTYYLQVIASNSLGAAIGCQEIVFSTNSVISYCGPVVGIGAEPITYVDFAGINNISPSDNSQDIHEYFTEIKGIVTPNTSYQISLNGNTEGDFTSKYVVFIDWNQNGSFSDLGEVYFGDGSLEQTNSDGVTSTPITAMIAVPNGVKIGDTRMRVKKSFSSGVFPDSSDLANPCSLAADYGQIEDYTLTVKEPVLGSVEQNKNKLAIFPNPFEDVLKISDLENVKSISIYDISGRQVKNFKPSAELNLSDLKTGLYIVNLNMEDGSVKSAKAIKK